MVTAHKKRYSTSILPLYVVIALTCLAWGFCFAQEQANTSKAFRRCETNAEYYKMEVCDENGRELVLYSREADADRPFIAIALHKSDRLEYLEVLEALAHVDRDLVHAAVHEHVHDAVEETQRDHIKRNGLTPIPPRFPLPKPAGVQRVLKVPDGDSD